MNKKRGNLLIVLGLLCLLAALGWFIHNRQLEHHAAGAAVEILDRLEPLMPETRYVENGVYVTVPEQSREDHIEEPEVPDYILDPDREMPVMEIDGVPYIAVLEVPDQDLNFPVCGIYSEQAMQQTPVWYSGSIYHRDLVLCAHNYQGHFRNIGSLRPGAPVRLTDMDGNVFNYEVVEVEYLNLNEVRRMKYGDDWDLTLFTCVLGQYKRVAVRCVLVSTSME